MNFSALGTIVLGGYLVLLLTLGVISRIRRRDNSADDFFLNKRSTGLLFLTLTLFATQYSGNTLIGYASTAYRLGAYFIFGVLQLIGVVGVYLLFAPKLHALSREHRFLTLGDYIQFRYQNRLLTMLIGVATTVALVNFIITNLIAVGSIAEILTDGALSYEFSILILVVVILVYEALGGFRGVVWTDAIQGLLVGIGIILTLSVVLSDLGGLQNGFALVMERAPELLAPPTFSDGVAWISTVLLVAFGAAIYPHAIQRIYASESAKTLRRAMSVLVFLPFVAVLPVLTWGLFGNLYFPNLGARESEQISPLLINEIGAQSFAGGLLPIVFLVAATAAIMSTVDSALLSSSATLVNDFHRRLSNTQKVWLAKLSSWVIMAFAVVVALVAPANIWDLIQLKFELLLPCVPALIFGLHSRRVGATAILSGFILGFILTLSLFTLGSLTDILPTRPLNIHAGLWGVALNIAVVVIGAFLPRKSASVPDSR